MLTPGGLFEYIPPPYGEVIPRLQEFQRDVETRITAITPPVINSAHTTVATIDSTDIGGSMRNLNTTANNFEFYAFKNASNEPQVLVGAQNLGSGATAGGSFLVATRPAGGSALLESMRVSSTGAVTLPRTGDLTLGTSGTDEPDISLATKHATVRAKLKTSSSVLNGVRDDLIRFGFNCDQEDATEPQWVNQFEYKYFDGVTTVSEWMLAYTPPVPFTANGIRPIFVVVERDSTPTALVQFSGRTEFFSTDRNTTPLIIEDGGNLLLESATTEIRRDGNNSKWLMQETSPGTGTYVSLIHLNNVDQIVLGADGGLVYAPHGLKVGDPTISDSILAVDVTARTVRIGNGNVADGGLELRAGAALGTTITLGDGTNTYKIRRGTAGNMEFVGNQAGFIAYDFNGPVTATNFIGPATGLTGIPAAQITGSIPDGILSANVALKNAACIFTAGVELRGTQAGETLTIGDGTNSYVIRRNVSTGKCEFIGNQAGLIVYDFNGPLTATTITASTQFTGPATGLTSIPAGQLTGTVVDARLSSNVPLKNATNIFTVAQAIGDATNNYQLRRNAGTGGFEFVGNQVGFTFYDMNGALNLSAGAYKVAGNQVVTGRKTGWGTPAGTLSRAAYTAYAGQTVSNPPTQAEMQALDDAVKSLSQKFAALLTDLHSATSGHGLIGT